MKRHCTGVIAAALVAFTASLAAQGQNPANVPPADAQSAPGVQKAPPAPSAQTRAADTVTISGCLQSAPATARGAADASGFVLANAQMGGARSSSGAVGTAGSTSPTSYRLEGEEKMISPHLNHQVRITGTVQNSAASAAGAGRAAEGSTAAGATLKVDKVEMVSATCETAAPAPRTSPAAPSLPEPGRIEKPAQPGQPSVPPDRQ